MMLLRHLLSIGILPFTVVVIVPRWILTSDAHAQSDLPHMIAGAVAFIAGFGLFAWCVSLFAMRGKGTLAPWDPTKKLVAVGPYRHVRNPMISGVAAMLGGEALFFQSMPLTWWFVFFLMLNHLYFMALEEPGLADRFGDEYARYKAAVPRWIPRLKPWHLRS